MSRELAHRDEGRYGKWLAWSEIARVRKFEKVVNGFGGVRENDI
jgi:hypothetical protein